MTKDPEKRRAYLREWNKKNREKLNAYYRENNKTPERKAYIREYRKREYQVDIDLGRERQRKHYHARKARDPEGTKREYFRRSIKNAYRLTLDEYNAMWAAQEFRCAICRTDDPKDSRGWHIDHCHDSLRVRGILCRLCNLMLGHSRDNPKTLIAAAEYLRANSEREPIKPMDLADSISQPFKA